MPNHDQIYNSQAAAYEALISKQPDLSEVIREIRPFANLDIVDLGAGSGRLSRFLAAEAHSLVATDQSRAMLEELEKSLTDVKRGKLRTVVADHRELPLETSTADLVVSGWSLCYLASSNVLDWQDNIKKMMAEINRVLRHDGTIIIIENFGSGCETPCPPDFLLPYYRVLEEEFGFSHKWIRTDYQFNHLEEAERLIRFFFGDRLAEKVVDNDWVVVPECAGIWWKHK